MIEFKNVSKYYTKDYPSIKNLNLRIKEGEFVSVVGKSGTGKTTLIKLLIADEKPSSGEILVGDWNISKIKTNDVSHLRRQIGVVFQDFKLLPKKTVQENIAFGLEVAGASFRHIREVVPRVLSIVNLIRCEHRYPAQLSGGEQQRVAIARSLVHRPKILVADEPTGNLDTIHSREIMQLLKKINEFGTTIVLVTHDREMVNALRKRVVTLDKGRIIADQEEGRYRL